MLDLLADDVSEDTAPLHARQFNLRSFAALGESVEGAIAANWRTMTPPEGSTVAEDFDRERLGRRAAEGLASFSPVVRGWARDLRSALAEIERLREALEACAACIEETGTWGLDALTKTRAALSDSQEATDGR